MTDQNDVKIARAVSMAATVVAIAFFALAAYGCQQNTTTDLATKTKCIEAGGAWILGTGCMKGFSP